MNQNKDKQLKHKQVYVLAKKAKAKYNTFSYCIEFTSLTNSVS